MTSILIFLTILIIILFFLGRKKNKHQKNISKGKKIIDKINSFEYPGQKINYLKKIDPFVFEELLLSAYKNKGFRIKRNKRYTGDGGIDGIIYNKDNEKIVLQAKRYSKYINRQHVRDFENSIYKEKAVKGYFIHTGKTSPETRRMFSSSNVELIGGNKLIELIAKVN
ncbi:restriction endonuclease [Muricauda sp. SCSIO 64092]|uniref:restriction endonuclease n=1 Tax=Allomuricauda sp. SCSIO 64092 TaxID=2908842 RepID=UPI001FF23C41|nr:restriction endonuclease [Muricauda sp. SCSIO 64092]UOY05732.1 restriction endonuclease [Muricauda sp. SCSIO 64092]